MSETACSRLISIRSAEERDHKLAKFISTIRPQTLKMIETIRDIGANAESFLALSGHSESVKDLRLCISNDSLPHLSLLRGCTAIESLKIEDVSGTTNLEASQNDVFLETVDWLCNCRSLRNVILTGVLAAPAIMTPVLLQHKIQLRELDIDSYILKDCRIFHQALVHQRSSLRFLSLEGDTDGMFRDDVDTLVDSLRQLTALKALRLLLGEVLHDEHIADIIDGLSQLETLYITGMQMNDGLLESIGSLGELRSVTFAGISKFTTDGLLEFVSRLGPGNRGIRVMVDWADPETLLSDKEVELIRTKLAEKVGGNLDYTPFRGRDRPFCS